MEKKSWKKNEKNKVEGTKKKKKENIRIRSRGPTRRFLLLLRNFVLVALMSPHPPHPQQSSPAVAA